MAWAPTTEVWINSTQEPSVLERTEVLGFWFYDLQTQVSLSGSKNLSVETHLYPSLRNIREGHCDMRLHLERCVGKSLAYLQ